MMYRMLFAYTCTAAHSTPPGFDRGDKEMGTPDRLFGSQEMSVGKGIGRVAERGYRRTLAKLVGVWDVLASLEGLVLFAVAITLTLSLMGAGQIAAVTINPGDILVADNGSSRVIRVDPVS